MVLGTDDLRDCVEAVGRTATLMERGLSDLRAADRITHERHEATQDAIDSILAALDVMRGAIDQAEQRARPAAVVVPFARRS